jgi:hypothetical protein
MSITKPQHQPLNQVIRQITSITNKLNDNSTCLVKKYETLSFRSHQYMNDEKSLSMQERFIQNKQAVF